MESSGSGSDGGPQCSCRVANYPSRSRRIGFLQGTLMFVTLTTQFHCAASERNESLTWFSDGPRPWNKTFYKIEHGCLDFRGAYPSSLFYYWPEDDPHFDHCCSVLVEEEIITSPLPDGLRLVDNFTNGIFGPKLIYKQYYDLGLIDRCLPYWKCYGYFQRLKKIFTYYTYCELTDMEGLYTRRFWLGTVLKHGLLQSALPFTLFLEVTVLLSVVLYCLLYYTSTWRRPLEGLKQLTKGAAAKDWLRAMHKTLLADLIHLALLAIIGNGLIEAVGHQSPYSSDSKSFDDYSTLYVVLTGLVWCSSFLQQLSYWISEIEDHYEKLPGGGEYDAPESSQLSRQSSVSEELEKKIGLNADWKWQPIAAQAGIGFCLWAFLTNVGSDAQGLFGLVVAAAAPWSGLYALKVISSCICFLVNQHRRYKRRLRFRPRIRGLWRGVINMRKLRGPRGNELGGAELCDDQREKQTAAILRDEKREESRLQGSAERV